MKFRNLKRGEVAATLLLGAVASGVAVSYGIKEMCGPNLVSFAKQWVADPVEMGACTPCSKHVAQNMLGSLNIQKNGSLTVLEVGAGTGSVTHAIADHLKGREFTLDAIEINSTFSETLKNEFDKNPHVTIHQADITKWQPAKKYDVIISTLPFNLLSIAQVEKVLKLYEKWIAPGGRISYVEGAGGSKFLKLFKDSKTQATFDKKYKLISEFKNAHLDETVTVLRNIPPYFVHHLKF